MKRRLLVSLLIVSVAAMSFGCGKREIPKDEIVETSDDPFDGMDELVPEKNAKITIMTSCVDFVTEMGERFKEKYKDYNIEIKVENKGLGLVDKLSVDGPAGTGADVIIAAHDEFIEGMNAELFLEISPKLSGDIIKAENEVGINSVTYDDKLYGVPVSLETSCMFYNKDIVGDKPAETFEEIAEKSLEYNDYTNNNFYFLVKIGDGYKLFPFMSAFGYRPFGEKGIDKDPGFSSDEYLKGLEAVAKLKDMINMKASDLNSDSYLSTLFKDGKLAYMFTGPWDVATFDSAGINYGVTTLPTYNGKAMTPFAGVMNAHVSAYTKFPRTAELFVSTLCTDEAASVLYEKENKITTLKDISNVSGINEDERIACFVKQFSDSVPMPSIAEVTYYWPITESISKLVFDKELTPEEGQKKSIENYKTLTESNK
ncbi:MAG: maltose ABC transporter substrate-binding protein [Lachnospiraceae bacterium]|nr:maltose ABC transporter substrate-binding protein [Lachnospiraceae bacterium]